MDNQFITEAQANSDRLAIKEEMLGKGLCQPFVDCNSGSRKLMFSVHVEQSLPLVYPQVPFIMTGYEQGFSEEQNTNE